jgi:geranylgeranyl pyrophosphate synthase
LDSLNRMVLTTAHGQDLDIKNPSDEASYWRVVENKSAPFYGGALHLGALLAEAQADVTDHLEQVGRLYGEMIQIHDDLNDTMAVPANPDWLQKRKPLPILFALTVEHPDQARFVDLHQSVPNGNTLEQAQEILIRCGAVSYCADQLLRRYQTIQYLLSKTPLPNRRPLDSLVEDVIAPVRKLFETLGVSSEALLKVEKPSNQA